MKKIIAVDAGTSNLRINVLYNDKVVYSIKSSSGVKLGKEKFENELYLQLNRCFKELNITKSDIDCIIASGMITSSLGIKNIPHLLLPVSLKDISQNLCKVLFKEYEFHLIPGIKIEKNYFGDNNLKSLDVIRGEETEVFGLIDKISNTTTLVVLPGSHNKFIKVENGVIVDFFTTMSGEFLDVITKNTILHNSLNSNFAEYIDEYFLGAGYRAGMEYGLNQAAFIVRGFDFLHDFTMNNKANFLLGVILSEDVSALMKNRIFEGCSKIIVAGNNIMSSAFRFILKTFPPICDVDIIKEDIAVKGASRIWNEYSKSNEQINN